MTHDAIYLGYLGLAQGVPLVVFQLWGGVLADRANRLRLLLGTQILTTAVLIAAFALSLTGAVRVGPLLALAALSKTFRAFDEPTRMSLVPQMVGRERLANAIALGSIPWQAGRICETERPPWRESGDGFGLRCHLTLDDLHARFVAAERNPQQERTI